MSNKKGFVLIETIITITVLAASLLYIYSSFNNVLIKEKTRVNYDDVAYIYRAYYIKDFFQDYELDYVLSLLNDDSPLIIIGCDYEGMFKDNTSARQTCNSLISSLDVSKIAVGFNDLSYVRECNDNSYKCNYLKNFSLEQRKYFETLGKIDKEKEKILLVEFDESTKTSENAKKFAWIKI